MERKTFKALNFDMDTQLLRPAEEFAMEEALLLPQETPEDGVG